MDEKEISCGVCGMKLESGDGRYNTSHGSICSGCYSPSLFWEKAVEGELIKKVLPRSKQEGLITEPAN